MSYRLPLRRTPMLSIRLKPALERRLARLARQTGRTKTFYATKLIEENIEDFEDRYIAEASLEKRDHQVQREILGFLDKRIGQAKDPRSFGKPLRHSKFGLWRYRLRDYRIICQLQQAKLIVLVVAIGHRSIIYDD